MQCIFQAKDPTQAHVLVEILESKGIHAIIQDEQTFSLRGEIPVVYPSVWVSDEHVEAARNVCGDFSARRHSPESVGEAWICPACGESIDPNFTDCWKCAAHSNKPEEPPPQKYYFEQLPLSSLKWIVLAATVVVGLCILYENYGTHESRSRYDTNSAVSLMKEGKNEQALILLDRAIAVDKKQPFAYFNRGLIHARMANYEKAIADHTQAIALGQIEPSKVYNARSSAFFASDRFDLAIADSNRAVQLSKSSHSYSHRAFLHSQHGDLNSAFEDIREALSIDSHFTYACYLKGMLYLQQGDTTAALQMAEDAIRSNSSLPYGYLLRGELSAENDQLSTALADFDHVIQIDKRHSSGYLWRGQIYFFQGKMENALADFSLAIEHNPKEIIGYYYRSRVFDALHQIEKARQDRAAITSLAAKTSFDCVFRAASFASVGDMTRAELDIQRAHELQPWNCWVDCYVAALYAVRAQNLPDDSTGDDSRKANTDKAVSALKAAEVKGLKSWKSIQYNPDFNILANDPVYRALAGK